MSKEYIIYADESEQQGTYYSNFFGGALVLSTDIEEVVRVLQNTKQSENLFQEIKWTKVTDNYLEKYKNVMNVFFELIRQRKIRVRIMFTNNQNIPLGLSKEQKENDYFMLYYQFIKYAFGLQYANEGNGISHCRLLLDEISKTEEKMETFKDYLANISLGKYFRGRIKIDRQQIGQIRSHDHVILQCLDVALGSMAFRLNQKHLAKLPEKEVYGKRTIAKNNLFEFILQQIQTIIPDFEISCTTPKKDGMNGIWDAPYRHWVFIPRKHRKTDEKEK